MGWCATQLWVSTRRFERTPAETRLLARAEIESLPVADSHVVTYHWSDSAAKDADNNADKHPQRPKVLLIHGWNGRASHLAGFVKPLLAAGYQVVALDTPGHGDSPGRRSSIFQITEALLALDREAGPFAAAVTHSFGGTCLVYALSQGLRVGRAVCIAMPGHFDGLVDKYATAVDMPARVRANMIRRLEKRYGEGFRERIDPVRVAPSLRLPGLLIHDRDDHDVPWTEGAEVAREWPGAELMLTDGLGHRRILRDRRTIRATARFIQGSMTREPPPSPD